MCGAAYTPAEVTEKPKYMGSRQQGKRLTLEGGADGDRLKRGVPMQRKGRLEHMRVIGLWDPSKMYVLYVWAVDTYKETYDWRHPQRILSQQERRKKYILRLTFREDSYFPPVFYVYRLMGKDTKAVSKQLDSALSNKWDTEYSETCRYVWSCISLNLLRSFILLVRGERSGKPRKARRMPAKGAEKSWL